MAVKPASYLNGWQRRFIDAPTRRLLREADVEGEIALAWYRPAGRWYARLTLTDGRVYRAEAPLLPTAVRDVLGQVAA